MKHRIVIKGIAMVLGLWSGLGSASVSWAQEETIRTGYQYAAKVVCSLLLPQQDATLARGTYRTIVNIHNPSNEPVTIAAKVALSSQFGQEPGEFSVTPFRKAVLQPDGATELSCFNIAGFFCPINGVCIDFAFLEGFVVIKSPEPLDVVGVYTARPTDGDVSTIDVETVEARLLEETVELYPTDTEPDGEDRLDYPPKDDPAYGAMSEPKQMCGGIAGIPCPTGQTCVDNPADDCNPTSGGADCPGICIGYPLAK